MAPHAHIARLNERIAKMRSERFDLIEEVVKAKRAVGATDEEIVQKLISLISEPADLGDAILKSFASPTPAGTAEPGLTVGARDVTQQVLEVLKHSPRARKAREARAGREAVESARLETRRAELRERRIR